MIHLSLLAVRRASWVWPPIEYAWNNLWAKSEWSLKYIDQTSLAQFFEDSKSQIFTSSSTADFFDVTCHFYIHVNIYLLQEVLVKKTSLAKRFANAALGFKVKRKCALQALAVLVLMARLVGLSMFIGWAVDCFVREFRTTALCENFRLFPSPKVFEGVWLSLCALTSAFFIFYLHCLSHFPGYKVVSKHLLCKTAYFWLNFATICSVCAYDGVVISYKRETSKTIVYVLFMIEKILVVALVHFLNFLPKVKSSLKLRIYQAALFVYTLESYTMAILGSTIAFHKVLNVRSDTPDTALMQPPYSEFQKNWTLSSAQQLQGGNNGYLTEAPPDVKIVASLMLLIVNNALRAFLGKFFFSKFFYEDMDILGGGIKRISESLELNGPANEPVWMEGKPLGRFSPDSWQNEKTANIPSDCTLYDFGGEKTKSLAGLVDLSYLTDRLLEKRSEVYNSACKLKKIKILVDIKLLEFR